MTLNIDIKIKYSYMLKLIYALIIMGFIITAYMLSNFLYENFYQVLTQNEDIVVLRKEVASEIVDVAVFETIFAHFNEKKKSLSFNVQDINNIFCSINK